MELAIDTSTDFAGIALTDHGDPIIEITWRAGQNHTTELIPNIDKVLKQNKITIENIKAILVAKGPGSFNGLRVGLSTAKGLALALNAPLIAISTLEVEAFPFAYTGLPICPIHNAGRGEIAVAKYQQEGEWRCLEIEHITTVEALIETIKSKTIFCGEIPDDAINKIRQTITGIAIIADNIFRLRRPGFLSALGWQRLINGEKDDPVTLQPIYLRQPPITQMKTKILKK